MPPTPSTQRLVRSSLMPGLMLTWLRAFGEFGAQPSPRWEAKALREMEDRTWALFFDTMMAAYGYTPHPLPLEVLDEAHWPTRLEFASWVQRMRTPPQRVDVIRSLLDEAPQEVRSALGVEPDGSFTIRTGLFWARKAAG